MIWLAIVCIVSVALIAGSHVVAQRSLSAFFIASLKAQELAATDRAVALYKQTKAANRSAVAEVNATAKTIRHLHEDARLMHQRTDALARDVKAGQGG